MPGSRAKCGGFKSFIDLNSSRYQGFQNCKSTESFLNINSPKTDRLTWPRWLLISVVAMAAYVAVARLGLRLASIHGNVSPVWPATGLAIWLLLAFGRSLWPAVAVGAFVANALTDVPWEVAVEIAAGNTLEAVIGVWLWEWVQLRAQRIQELREPLGCVVTSLLAPVASATIGVGSLLGAGIVPLSASKSLWITWWVGDALGALTVLPVLLAVPEMCRWMRLPPVNWMIKAIVVLAMTGGVSGLAFMLPNGGAFLFGLFPLLLLALVGFGPAGARLVALLIAIIGVGATYFGHGPFTTGAANQDLLNLQVFLGAVTVTTLVLPIFGIDRRSRLPVTVLLVGWILSGWVFATSQQESRRTAQEVLDERIAAAETSIQVRVSAYEEALRGGVSLFAASEYVGRLEWRQYTDSLQLARRFPGINGIGVVFKVRPNEVDSFLQRMRGEGVPNFSLHTISGTQPSPNQDMYVTGYFEPQATNPQVLGLDLASEPSRRQAAERARDTGSPTMTSRIALTQDGHRRPAFLLLVPFYRHGAAIQTAAEREVALEGWIDAAFVTEEFLRGVLGPQKDLLQLHFFEAGGMDRDHLLYASADATDRIPSRFDRVTELELAGRRFQLGWNRGPKYPVVGVSLMVWAAASFAIATLLLAGLVRSLQTFRRRAEQLAAKRTIELEQAQQKLALANLSQREVLDGTNFAIISTSPDGVIVSFNATAERLLGYRSAEVIGRAKLSDFHLDEELMARAAELTAQLQHTVQPAFEALATIARLGKIDEREWTYLRKDGTRFPVLASVSALRDGQGNITGFLATAQDLSQQKQIVQALQNSEQRLQQVLIKADCLVWEARVVLQEKDWSWRMIVHPSGMYSRLMGVSQPTHAGLWYQFEIPEQTEMNERCRKAMLEGAAGYTQEFRLLK